MFSTILFITYKQKVQAMKVINAMFSRGLGGIEQVFLDYNHALNLAHMQVIPVVHPKAHIREKIYGHYESISNFNQYDPFAVYKLRKLIAKEQPQCIITHGNRATQLFRKATNSVPIIAVCHNYKYKPLIGSDAIIAITKDLKKHLIAAGQPKDAVYHITNMIHFPETAKFSKPKISKVPVLGFMGRFVAKKGTAMFLESLKILKDKKIKFKARIAGSGEEEANLLKLVQKLGLEKEVKFVGWVSDKEDFFEAIDIFCIPSHHEPFGLVLLEAFLHSKPVVTTASEGPSEIAKHMRDALFSQLDNPKEFASNIQKLINNPQLAQKLATKGFQTLQKYTTWNISRKLQLVLEEICFKKLECKYFK